MTTPDKLSEMRDLEASLHAKAYEVREQSDDLLFYAVKVEDTLEWKAANSIATLLSEVERLRSALKDERERCVKIIEARAATLIATGEQIGWAERHFWAENTKLLAQALRLPTGEGT